MTSISCLLRWNASVITVFIRWYEENEKHRNLSGISHGPDDIHISVAIHVFRIRADRLEYEVTVDHKSVLIKRLSFSD